MKFFCSQCRKAQEIEKYSEFFSKTGTKMARSSCPVCGLTLYRRVDATYKIGAKDSE